MADSLFFLDVGVGVGVSAGLSGSERSSSAVEESEAEEGWRKGGILSWRSGGRYEIMVELRERRRRAGQIDVITGGVASDNSGVWDPSSEGYIVSYEQF